MVSVIIPTFNDTTRLEEIIGAACQVELVGEVIVVNDGSDEKHKIVLEGISKRFPEVVFLAHPLNRGKAAAMKTGLLKAKKEVVLFLDADLIGLNPHHIKKLVEPILTGQYDLTISKRGRGADKFLGLFGYSQALSGERAVRCELLRENIDLFENRGYLIESAMNQRFFGCLRVALVPLPEVSHPVKISKWGLGRALLMEFGFYRRLAREIGLKGVIWQSSFARNLPVVS